MKMKESVQMNKIDQFITEKETEMKQYVLQ